MAYYKSRAHVSYDYEAMEPCTKGRDGDGEPGHSLNIYIYHILG